MNEWLNYLIDKDFLALARNDVISLNSHNKSCAFGMSCSFDSIGNSSQKALSSPSSIAIEIFYKTPLLSDSGMRPCNWPQRMCLILKADLLCETMPGFLEVNCKRQWYLMPNTWFLPSFDLWKFPFLSLYYWFINSLILSFSHSLITSLTTTS